MLIFCRRHSFINFFATNPFCSSVAARLALQIRFVARLLQDLLYKSVFWFGCRKICPTNPFCSSIATRFALQIHFVARLLQNLPYKSVFLHEYCKIYATNRVFDHSKTIFKQIFISKDKSKTGLQIVYCAILMIFSFLIIF